MIRITDMNLTYPDGTKAVSELCMHILPGQRCALIGANGAGKSTLMLAILGIIPLASGEIRVGGTVLSKKTAPQIRKIAGLVFQNPDDQLFTTRVYDDVAFGPRNAGLSEPEVKLRVSAALEMLGITHLAEKMPHRISGGEKRRAAIATVLSMQPSLLLMDEPTSFLDPRARRQTIAAISALPQTMLIATHDMDMAAQLCDRVILLQNGSIKADGTPDLLRDSSLLQQNGL